VRAEALGEALVALGKREQRVSDAQQELQEYLPGVFVEARTVNHHDGTAASTQMRK
jgi:hypothetical protein